MYYILKAWGIIKRFAVSTEKMFRGTESAEELGPEKSSFYRYKKGFIFKEYPDSFFYVRFLPTFLLALVRINQLFPDI
jgi:hypothetical protein